MLVVVSCGKVVFLQQTNPCVWTNVARSIYARHGFSDLTKLPGEEQVDIIAWGTQGLEKHLGVSKKIWEPPPNHPFL